MRRWAIRLGRNCLLLLLVSLLAACQSQPKIQNYPILRQHLQAQNWRAADAETLKLLLQISQRNQSGWLRAVDVASLDCGALNQIDQLWTEASAGKFGFNQQRQIWLAVGGQVGEYSPEIAAKFGERVGWRRSGQWRKYDQLNFTNKAVPGHLPALTGNGVSGSVWGGVATLSQRLQHCRRPMELLQARAAEYADCDQNPQQHRCQLKLAAEFWQSSASEPPSRNWDKEIPKVLDQLDLALANRRWHQADQLTRTLWDHYRMVNWLKFQQPDAHRVIPCYLLKPVDDLWMQYSKGWFGLTAQADVLTRQKLLSPIQNLPAYQRRDRLLQALGWKLDAGRNRQNQAPEVANGVSPSRFPKGYYPKDMGHSYSTYGSAYNYDWRFDLSPACGFQGMR